MGYREAAVRLDLSSSGRGLQQTLLILAHMYANPSAILLLDEPDAHLEFLRQRDIYELLAEVAEERRNQIIVASHSEVILNEAANRGDPVIAFVGKPHRMPPSRRSEVRKALVNWGFEQYHKAEQTGWVLYLEGPTDLMILRAFAKRLWHEKAIKALVRPFVHFTANQPKKVFEHYFGIREAVPSLQGVALYDRLKSKFEEQMPLMQLQWRRREIENYMCTRATLDTYADEMSLSGSSPSLLDSIEEEQRRDAMSQAIHEVESAMETLGKGSPWSVDAKVSNDFLEPVFIKYFEKLGFYNSMSKNSFHKLVEFLPASEIDPEITEKLDAIAEVAEQARPRA